MKVQRDFFLSTVEHVPLPGTDAFFTIGLSIELLALWK
jgi:hypothetical protein